LYSYDLFFAMANIHTWWCDIQDFDYILSQMITQKKRVVTQVRQILEWKWITYKRSYKKSWIKWLSDTIFTTNSLTISILWMDASITCETNKGQKFLKTDVSRVSQLIDFLNTNK